MTDNREINYEGQDWTGFSKLYLFMAYSMKVSSSIQIRLSWRRMDGRLVRLNWKDVIPSERDLI
jgi:hypothetical protein